MRALFVTAVLLLVGPLSLASAETLPFHGGIVRISISADVPFDTLVWYPTQANDPPGKRVPS